MDPVRSWMQHFAEIGGHFCRRGGVSRQRVAVLQSEVVREGLRNPSLSALSESEFDSRAGAAGPALAAGDAGGRWPAAARVHSRAGSEQENILGSSREECWREWFYRLRRDQGHLPQGCLHVEALLWPMSDRELCEVPDSH